MTASGAQFLARKRWPSARSFLTPVNLPDLHLIEALTLLADEIVKIKSPQFLQKRNVSKMMNKVMILSSMFQSLGDPQPATLCFREIFILLQRIKVLIEDCSIGSKLWLLIHNESISDRFHLLTLEMSTLLDILPLDKLDLSEELEQEIDLLLKQCRVSKTFINPAEQKLRSEILSVVEEIERRTAPDSAKLSEILGKLGIGDSESCNEEIRNLEEEIQNQSETSTMAGLIGLLKYCNCVLFYNGALSSPVSDARKKIPATETSVPDDFRCPISLELMVDPVIVATGHTYDRVNIQRWIEKGNLTCPKTGQILLNTSLTPNLALRNLIRKWCKEQNIPLKSNSGDNAVTVSKAAVEAAKMTASFLIEKLACSRSAEETRRLIYGLRKLAKLDSDNRAYLGEAGAVTALLAHFGSDDPNVQVNAVTCMLNLSLLEENKTRLTEANGGLHAVIEVLESGHTLEARGNAAATICSVSSLREYKKRVGEEPGAIRGLTSLLTEGSTRARCDALAAIFSLAMHRDNVGKIAESGAVGSLVEMLAVEGEEGELLRRDGRLVEAAVKLVEIVVKKGCEAPLIEARVLVVAMAKVLKCGSAKAKEHAAAVLVLACKSRGWEVIEEMTMVPSMMHLIGGAMRGSTPRGLSKAIELRQICRMWAAKCLPVAGSTVVPTTPLER